MLPTVITDNPVMEKLVGMVPHKPPFRFIDTITFVDDSRIEGSFYLDPESEFYQGHFPDYPLTPGVILVEIMAQIGLVAFGLYLLNATAEAGNVLLDKIPVLFSADINFRKKVLPGEQVYVVSEKILFRHGKLLCKVKLLNEEKGVVAEGTLGGYILSRN